MAKFSDLPIEIHSHLIYICALQGHSVLSKYALLSRQHFQLARPLLHTAVDLSKPTCSPDSLSQFIYHCAPHHRTDFQWLSMAFRPSPPRSPYDELDECLSQILSLLVTITDLELVLETSDDIEDSFLLTIQALERFTGLRNLTLRGQAKLYPRVELILQALPKLLALDTLTLEGLTLVMPNWERGASHVRALEITNCLVVQDSTSSTNPNMGSFIDLFGPTLNVLRLENMSTTDQAFVAKFSAPLLSRLWLSDFKTHPSRPKSGQTQEAKDEQEEDGPMMIQRRYWNLLNKFALVGPIRQLVLEDPWISSFGAAKIGLLHLAFSQLEDIQCQSALSVVDFLSWDQP